MNFLIDAQLPPELATVLSEFNCNCTHINNLPKGDRTPDKEIREFADRTQYVLVTKDFDFYYSHLAIQSPLKLLLITTGNIKNKDPFDLVRRNAEKVIRAFESSRFIELSNTDLIIIE